MGSGLFLTQQFAFFSRIFRSFFETVLPWSLEILYLKFFCNPNKTYFLPTIHPMKILIFISHHMFWKNKQPSRFGQSLAEQKIGNSRNVKSFHLLHLSTTFFFLATNYGKLYKCNWTFVSHPIINDNKTILSSVKKIVVATRKQFLRFQKLNFFFFLLKTAQLIEILTWTHEFHDNKFFSYHFLNGIIVMVNHFFYIRSQKRISIFSLIQNMCSWKFLFLYREVINSLTHFFPTWLFWSLSCFLFNYIQAKKLLLMMKKLVFLSLFF